MGLMLQLYSSTHLNPALVRSSRLKEQAGFSASLLPLVFPICYCIYFKVDRCLTVSCFSKIQIGFTFLVLAHLGSPGKRAVERVIMINVMMVMVMMMVWLECCVQNESGDGSHVAFPAASDSCREQRPHQRDVTQPSPV